MLEGSDLKGRPVQLIRLGKADLPGIEREVGREKWIEYCCLKNEALFEEIRKRCLAQNTFETSRSIHHGHAGFREPPRVGRATVQGDARRHGAQFSRKTLRNIHRERAGGFSWLYGMVKGFLNPGTAAKVQVFGASDDHLKALLEVMPRSTIPDDFGGVCVEIIRRVDARAAPRHRAEVRDGVGRLKFTVTQVGKLRCQRMSGAAGVPPSPSTGPSRSRNPRPGAPTTRGWPRAET